MRDGVSAVPPLLEIDLPLCRTGPKADTRPHDIGGENRFRLLDHYDRSGNCSRTHFALISLPGSHRRRLAVMRRQSATLFRSTPVFGCAPIVERSRSGVKALTGDKNYLRMIPTIWAWGG